MATKPNRAIKIFYCYAPADKELRVELEKHLEVLRRPGRIIGLYDGVIQAGTELKCEINRQLYTSDILLFISHNFMASQDCCDQMARAPGRHRTGKIRTVPNYLESCCMGNFTNW